MPEEPQAKVVHILLNHIVSNERHDAEQAPSKSTPKLDLPFLRQLRGGTLYEDTINTKPSSQQLTSKSVCRVVTACTRCIIV